MVYASRPQYARHGSMRSDRIIIHLGVTAAIALAVVPSAAQASSLLSGYGGPGEGNQAVLGSALVNGPTGGGGAGSGGSSSSGSAGSTPAGSGAQGSGSASSGGSSRGSTSRGAGSSSSPTAAGGRSVPGGSAHRSAGTSVAPGRASSGAQTFYPMAERVPAGQQGGVLGLSGSNLLYVIVGFAVLVLVAVLTRRLGGPAPRRGVGG